MTGTLRETLAAFRSGALAKQDFIAAMHALHERLFEYPDLLANGSIARIEIDAAGVDFVDRSGIRFRINPDDRREPPLDALNFGTFEGADEAMLERLIGPSDVVFDVGGNIGWYSLRWAKSRPSCSIHSFEPAPATAKRLRTNLTRNNITNVVVHEFGLSDRNGAQTFFVDPSLPSGAAAVDHTKSPAVVQLTVPVRKLDDVVRELGVSPNVVKIDVEGAELFVLRGAGECLAHAKPVVFCEILRRWTRSFGYEANDILALLGTAGYDCFEVAGERLQPFMKMEESTTATNFVFLHESAHSDLRRNVAA